VHFRLLLKLFTVKRLKGDMSLVERDSCKFKQCGMKLKNKILITKANKMHYFSTLFWYRTLYVSDRSTVHHQGS